MKTQHSNDMTGTAQAVSKTEEPMKVKLVLWEKAAIKDDQDGIRKDVLSLDQRVHNNAVQCMLHASVHGDTSLMRRLLIDIVDTKTGFRRQGLINWMRKHSPMELSGDTINLSGTIQNDAQVTAMKKMFPDADHALFVVGQKRPFLTTEAAASPFWTDSANAERVARPVFKNTILSPINKAIKDFEAAMENTVNGQPVDPSKPTYMGIHTDKVVDFFAKVKELRDQLPPDDTSEVYARKQRVAEDLKFIQGAEAAEVDEKKTA